MSKEIKAHEQAHRRPWAFPHLDSVSHIPLPGLRVASRGTAGLWVEGAARPPVGPEEAHEGVMLAGGDALAGAAGGGQAVLHACQAALARRVQLVHHGKAGLDGGWQVAQGDLTGGGAPAWHKACGGHPQGGVTAAVAVRGLAGY